MEEDEFIEKAEKAASRRKKRGRGRGRGKKENSSITGRSADGASSLKGGGRGTHKRARVRGGGSCCCKGRWLVFRLTGYQIIQLYSEQQWQPRRSEPQQQHQCLGIPLCRVARRASLDNNNNNCRLWALLLLLIPMFHHHHNIHTLQYSIEGFPCPLRVSSIVCLIVDCSFLPLCTKVLPITV